LIGSDGEFTRTPETTTVVPGTLLRLNCSSSLSNSVLWRFTRKGSNSTTGVTNFGVLTDKFKPYFRLDDTSLYDLVALTSNADESYCGKYDCIENAGGGDRATATVASKRVQYNKPSLFTFFSDFKNAFLCF